MVTGTFMPTDPLYYVAHLPPRAAGGTGHGTDDEGGYE